MNLLPALDYYSACGVYDNTFHHRLFSMKLLDVPLRFLSPHGLNLDIPEELDLYGPYVCYAVQICNFVTSRVKHKSQY